MKLMKILLMKFQVHLMFQLIVDYCLFDKRS